MGVRVIHDREQGRACLYCSTSEWAFGPVFHAEDGYDAAELAEDFLSWLGRCDARSKSDLQLQISHQKWRADRAERKEQDEQDAITALVAQRRIELDDQHVLGRNVMARRERLLGRDYSDHVRAMMERDKT